MKRLRKSTLDNLSERKFIKLAVIMFEILLSLENAKA